MRNHEICCRQERKTSSKSVGARRAANEPESGHAAQTDAVTVVRKEQQFSREELMSSQVNFGKEYGELQRVHIAKFRRKRGLLHSLPNIEMSGSRYTLLSPSIIVQSLVHQPHDSTSETQAPSLCFVSFRRSHFAPTNLPSLLQVNYRPMRSFGIDTTSVSIYSVLPGSRPLSFRNHQRTRDIRKSLNMPLPFPPMIHRFLICVGRV